jgi:hypothetical protein
MKPSQQVFGALVVARFILLSSCSSGSKNPASNSTLEGGALNRRVELVGQ